MYLIIFISDNFFKSIETLDRLEGLNDILLFPKRFRLFVSRPVRQKSDRWAFVISNNPVETPNFQGWTRQWYRSTVILTTSELYYDSLYLVQFSNYHANFKAL